MEKVVFNANLMFLADIRILRNPEYKKIVKEALEATGIDVPPEPCDTYHSRIVQAARAKLTASGDKCLIPSPKA